nr:DUF350 domain-containing protein [uncultured Cellulosilyticum sp.]
MWDVLVTVIYSAVGLLLMIVGNFLIDLAIPCDFPEEIKKRNTAVGYIMAGASISIGLIVRSAVMSPGVEVIEQTLMGGVVSTVLYSALGIILCILGYLGLVVFNRKYDLNKEIGEGNGAAGLMVMGMFIGLALIISGVIY